MTYSQVLSARIMSLCEQQNISVEVLAERSGLEMCTLDNIMQDKTYNPRIETLHFIANGFNMTVAQFLDFEELNRFRQDNS